MRSRDSCRERRPDGGPQRVASRWTQRTCPNAHMPYFPVFVRRLVRLELQAAAIMLNVYLTAGPAQSAVAWLELRASGRWYGAGPACIRKSPRCQIIGCPSCPNREVGFLTLNQAPANNINFFPPFPPRIHLLGPLQSALLVGPFAAATLIDSCLLRWLDKVPKAGLSTQL